MNDKVGNPTSSGSDNPLAQLRPFTPARIALGRAGDSLPTRELLDFNLDHALARDAVYELFDARSILEQLKAANLESVLVSSAAIDRATYLRRPDLGRKLDETSRERLSALRPPVAPDVVFVVADGLSAVAPQRYAVPVIEAACRLLDDWRIGPVILAKQARVALGDEIGELLGAEIVVVLLGERPGLSSPDSLGIYLTYAPGIGRTDAERNCISNVRLEGMSPDLAAKTLCHLLANSRRLRLSGIELKDESDRQQPLLPIETPAARRRRLSSG